MTSNDIMYTAWIVYTHVQGCMYQRQTPVILKDMIWYDMIWYDMIYDIWYDIYLLQLGLHPVAVVGSVTDDQVRTQIIDVLGGETGKNPVGRMKYCLGLR
jgi:hypothetical protein